MDFQNSFTAGKTECITERLFSVISCVLRTNMGHCCWQQLRVGQLFVISSVVTGDIKFALWLFVWDTSPPKLLNIFGCNFAQGLRSVQHTPSHTLVVVVPRVPSEEPKMYCEGKIVV